MVTRYWVTVVLCLCTLFAHSEDDSTRSENIRLENLVNEAERLIYANPSKVDSILSVLKKESIAANDSDYIMIAHLLKGVGHSMKNEFAHGLREFYLVYEYALNNKDVDLQINSLNNMAGVYSISGNYSKAAKMQETALALIDPTNDQYLYANMNMAIGTSYNKLGKYDSALVCLKKSIKIFKTQNEMHLAQSCMNEMGHSLERQKRYKDALEIYNSMMALYPYTEDVRGEIVTHQRKGNVLMRLGRMREAVGCLETSLALSDSVGYQVNKDTTFVRLIKANASIGNIASAENYANRLIKYVEDRESKRNSELMAFVESKYNLAEQERINESLVSELQAARADLSETRLYLRFAAAGVVILILSLLVMYRRVIASASTEKVFE